MRRKTSCGVDPTFVEVLPRRQPSCKPQSHKPAQLLAPSPRNTVDCSHSSCPCRGLELLVVHPTSVTTHMHCQQSVCLTIDPSGWLGPSAALSHDTTQCDMHAQRCGVTAHKPLVTLPPSKLELKPHCACRPCRASHQHANSVWAAGTQPIQYQPPQGSALRHRLLPPASLRGPCRPLQLACLLGCHSGSHHAQVRAEGPAQHAHTCEPHHVQHAACVHGRRCCQKPLLPHQHSQPRGRVLLAL